MIASERNKCGATFTLLGFSDYPEFQVPLFLIFLAIYGVTAIGNLGMIVIIKINPKLHTPMYFFLNHLSFVGFCYFSIVAPKTMINPLVEDRTISLVGCIIRLFFFCTFVVTEYFLLAVMAYDHFVAIWPYLFFCLFRAPPTAYGGSQARGWIGAVAASLHHHHSNTGSEPHLWPTPQLLVTPHP